MEPYTTPRKMTELPGSLHKRVDQLLFLDWNGPKCLKTNSDALYLQDYTYMNKCLLKIKMIM